MSMSTPTSTSAPKVNPSLVSGTVHVKPLLEAIPDSNLRRDAQKSISQGADMNLMVRVFHQVYGLPIVAPSDAKADFSHITRSRLAMRFGLIVEEFMELCEAMDIRADINFHYLDESGDYIQSRSVCEMEAYEAHQAEILMPPEVVVVYGADGNVCGVRLLHDDISDAYLQQIVRERLQVAVEETEERSIVDVADACCDLKYVIIGFELELGIDPSAVAREVQASNLSKLGADGRPIYREDGKVMKGPNYFTARVELALRSWGMKIGRVFGR